MAATRLLAIHHLKGKTVMQCLKDRIEYSINPMKTEQGKYTSFYECTPEAVVEEFALAKRQYEYKTGRKQERGVIAYMIRQSFKPGEIEPEEANKLGYDLAMRFTKGQHMFFVATHTDREHVHNHVVFNSTTLDCTRKFKNFFLSGKSIQKLSDYICVENTLSVIEPKSYSERTKVDRYKESLSKRDMIRNDIDSIMQCGPKNLAEVLDLLNCKGYEIKYGKHVAIKGKNQQRFIRLDSLGDGYTQEDLEKVFVGGIRIKKKKKGYQKSLSLLIDIQKKMEEGKGGGYTHWAKIFNIKQMAQTILFLQEHNFESFEELDIATKAAVDRFYQLSSEIKESEYQLGVSKELKRQIINYIKTRDVYEEYRRAGYGKKFLEIHKEEIQTHKEAKKAFDKLGTKNIPKVKELNKEISEIYSRKHVQMEEYYQAKEEMREFLTVRENVRRVLENQNVDEKMVIPTKKIIYEVE